MSPRPRKLCSRMDLDPADESAVATLEPVTFDQVQRRRIVSRLAEYRELVAKAAAGTPTIEEMSRAGDLLAALGVPLRSWEKDLQAHRDYQQVVASEAEAAATRDADERRSAELVETIRRLEQELQAAKAEHYTVSHVRPMTRVGLAQRRNELTVAHGHLFRELDEAAEMRLADRGSVTINGNRSSEGWH